MPFEEIIMYTRSPWDKISQEDLLKTAIKMSSIESKIEVFFI